MSEECQYCEFYSREIEKLQKQIETLEVENKKLREALERSLKAADFFYGHADCKRDSWTCNCAFCRSAGQCGKELREAGKVLKELKDKERLNESSDNLQL